MGLTADLAGRVGLVAWRRRSSLLAAAGLLALCVLGLHYSSLGGAPVAAAGPGAGAAVGAAGQEGALGAAAPESNALEAGERRADGGVKFVKADARRPELEQADAELPEQAPGELPGRRADQADLGGPGGDAGDGPLPGDQPSRDEVARRRDAQHHLDHHMEQRPYVPAQRLAHFDLKGAPPKVSYMKKMFALLRQVGATGVLLEWEDTFPFWGALSDLATTNAYSRSEVREILAAAKKHQLDVIPLVQTFGHVEFALKLDKLSSLREVPESPQALCPSNNASMDFITAMIAQVMELHPGVRYLHIGCDEVFQMGECPRCRPILRENLYLSHVARVATHVRQKYSGVVPLIWHDMLQHLPAQSMDEYRIGELVEPMVWVYAEDVYRFVPTMVWDKFATVFPRVWAASAFKGAFGETMYIPNVKRHLENNLRWLEVMASEGPKFKQGFQGIAVTGWQRYDHFAVLCELLPAAVPSLAVNLLAVTHGYMNPSLRNKLNIALSCVAGGGVGAGSGAGGGNGIHNNPQFLNLNSDPFLWDMFNRCFFPGVPFYRLTYRLHGAQREVREFLHSVTKAKGWMTDYNVRHNFSSPLRVDELMMDQPRVYHTLASLAHAANEALSDVFDAHTIAEWVEQRIYPDIKRLEQLAEDAAALKSRKTWPRRPLPPLPELRRLGVVLPGDELKNGTITAQPRPARR